MTDNKALEIDIDRILRDKVGSKAKFVPRCVVNWLKRIVHQEDLNEFLAAHRDEEGVEWLQSAVKETNMKLNIVGLDNLPANDDRRYTFVSNHPLGGIDGITIGAVLGQHYDGNIRYLLNDMLMNLPGLRPLGIPINKTGSQSRSTPRMVDDAFNSGHHIIMFPAGLCSRRIKGQIQDLPWKKAVIQKSVKTQRDIVPMHFSGQNSDRFYRIANWSKMLGLKFNLAMLFLADEVYRNFNKEFTLHIGKPIPWQTFDRSRTPQEWAQWLRQQVYQLND